jgi:fatty-acyl-CoA synthase
VSFLAKAASVYPERLAIIHGGCAATGARPTRAAGSSRRAAKHGVKRGDTVAAMLPNVPAMVELHFGPAMFGAVLNTLNTRLDAEAIAFMLDHGEAKVLFTRSGVRADSSKRRWRCRRRSRWSWTSTTRSIRAASAGLDRVRSLHRRGRPGFEWQLPPDEWDAIALNYTSGTTGNPKGVVYHYRGAYLNAVNNILDWSMPKHPVYLWTLPMFHCNGWCFNWTIAAAAGTNVCLRKVDAKAILDLDPRATRDALLRRADRALDAAQRAGRVEAGHRARGACLVAAGAAARGGDRGHGPHGLRHHARLRPHRDLWARGGVREAPEWSELPLEEQVRATAARASPTCCRKAWRCIDPERMQPVPPTARPWARSCSAATSP